MIIDKFKAPPEKWSTSQVAKELGVDERTLERYLADPKLKKVLCAIRQNGRWKCLVPASRVMLEPLIRAVNLGRYPILHRVFNPVNERYAYFQRVREALKSSGRRLPDSMYTRAVLRGMGFGSPRRERELAVLRLALDLERRSQEKRLTRKWRDDAQNVWFNARIVSANYGCRVCDVPKYFSKHLMTWSESNREHNAPLETWLREHGIYERAKQLVQKNPRATLVAFVRHPLLAGRSLPKISLPDGTTRPIDLKPRAKIYLLPFARAEGKHERWKKMNFIEHMIQLWPVNSPAELRRECERFNNLWPSRKILSAAEKNYTRAWQLRDLQNAVVALRKTGKPIARENLLPFLHLNEMAEVKKKPGIATRTFRRRYKIGDMRRAKRQAGQSAAENPDEVKTKTQYTKHDTAGLDKSAFQSMGIQSSTGFDLPNFYADEGADTFDGKSIASNDDNA